MKIPNKTPKKESLTPEIPEIPEIPESGGILMRILRPVQKVTDSAKASVDNALRSTGVLSKLNVSKLPPILPENSELNEKLKKAIIAKIESLYLDKSTSLQNLLENIMEFVLTSSIKMSKKIELKDIENFLLDESIVRYMLMSILDNHRESYEGSDLISSYKRVVDDIRSIIHSKLKNIGLYNKSLEQLNGFEFVSNSNKDRVEEGSDIEKKLNEEFDGIFEKYNPKSNTVLLSTHISDLFNSEEFLYYDVREWILRDESKVLRLSDLLGKKIKSLLSEIYLEKARKKIEEYAKDESIITGNIYELALLAFFNKFFYISKKGEYIHDYSEKKHSADTNLETDDNQRVSSELSEIKATRDEKERILNESNVFVLDTLEINKVFKKFKKLNTSKWPIDYDALRQKLIEEIFLEAKKANATYLIVKVYKNGQEQSLPKIFDLTDENSKIEITNIIKALTNQTPEVFIIDGQILIDPTVKPKYVKPIYNMLFRYSEGSESKVLDQKKYSNKMKAAYGENWRETFEELAIDVNRFFDSLSEKISINSINLCESVINANDYAELISIINNSKDVVEIFEARRKLEFISVRIQTKFAYRTKSLSDHASQVADQSIWYQVADQILSNIDNSTDSGVNNESLEKTDNKEETADINPEDIEGLIIFKDTYLVVDYIEDEDGKIKTLKKEVCNVPNLTGVKKTISEDENGNKVNRMYLAKASYDDIDFYIYPGKIEDGNLKLFRRKSPSSIDTKSIRKLIADKYQKISMDALHDLLATTFVFSDDKSLDNVFEKFHVSKTIGGKPLLRIEKGKGEERAVSNNSSGSGYSDRKIVALELINEQKHGKIITLCEYRFLELDDLLREQSENSEIGHINYELRRSLVLMGVLVPSGVYQGKPILLQIENLKKIVKNRSKVEENRKKIEENIGLSDIHRKKIEELKAEIQILESENQNHMEYIERLKKAA